MRWRTTSQPMQLSPDELAAVAETTAASGDQDDAADYHDGTPWGGTAWWERAEADEDSDGM